MEELNIFLEKEAFKFKHIYDYVIKEFKKVETYGDVKSALFCVYASMKYIQSCIYSQKGDECGLKEYFARLVMDFDNFKTFEESFDEAMERIRNEAH